MKLRSFFSTCSAIVSTATDDPTTFQPRLFSDTTSTISDSTSFSSLNTNPSLQTLPSIPSLQKLSPESLNLSVSFSHLTSLKTPNNINNSPINHLAIINHLLYACAGNVIYVFDTSSFTLLDTFNAKQPSSGSVKSVTFSQNMILTSHQDSKIRVWRMNENKKHHKHKQTGTLPTLEDRLLRSVFQKNYVKVRRHRRRLWIEHHDAVSGLAVIDHEAICSVSWDKYLKVWDTTSLRCMESVKAHDDAINAVVVSRDGTIYTGSADRRIKVWAKPTMEKKYLLIATLEKHKSAVNALALNDTGSVLFSGACDRSILVWEKEDSANHMAVTGALRGHSKAILCLINVSDLLFSGSADRTVRIWQRAGIVGKFSCLAVLDGHKQPVRSLVADLDSDIETESESATRFKVFSGSFEGEIRIWKVEVLKLDSPMSTHLLKMRV